MPLPTGPAALFDGDLLVGEAPIADRAVGEEVELIVGESPQVQVAQHKTQGDRSTATIEISNANPFAVTIEVTLTRDDGVSIVKPSGKLRMKDGRQIWSSDVPANQRATLSYSVQRKR